MTALGHSGSVYVPPRLVGFYGDVWDDQGNYVGYRPIAWGIVTAEGRVATIPADGTRSVTLWESVDDVVVALEAKVDLIDPRATLRADAQGADA